MSKNNSGWNSFWDNVIHFSVVYDQGVSNGSSGMPNTYFSFKPVENRFYDHGHNVGVQRIANLNNNSSNFHYFHGNMANMSYPDFYGGNIANYPVNSGFVTSYPAGGSVSVQYPVNSSAGVLNPVSTGNSKPYYGSSGRGCLSTFFFVMLFVSIVTFGIISLVGGTNAAGSVGDRGVVGTSARISNNVPAAALRRSPGYRGKPDSDVIEKIEKGDYVVIVGNSMVVDDIVWWKVRWRDVEGWVAQNRSKESGGAGILEFSP